MIDLGQETNELISTDNISRTEKDELNTNESEEVNEDPRRKRRRSSASS